MPKNRASSTAKSGAQKRRGPKPRFTPEEVLAVALGISRADGLGAVTLKRVADELGITSMGVYRYFDSKEALLTAMAASMVDPNPIVDPKVPWDEQLRVVIVNIHEALLAHPGLGYLFATTVLDGLAVDSAKDGLYGILYRAGFSAQEAVDSLWTIFFYVTGAVAAHETVAAQTSDEEMLRLANLPADEFPVLAEIGPKYESGGDIAVFSYGLDLLIQGLEARLEASQGRATKRGRRDR
jgi:TetR/AcrR family transcriptional regulator, tetracycline repressor protein